VTLGRPDAVLCDRDGTLIVDVPYNDDPALVRPLPTVRHGLARLRAAGIAVGIVSNQSGIARGRLTEDDVVRVMGRVDDLLGPFAAVVWCPHGPDDGCACRKPRPGLLLRAVEELDLDLERSVMIGDALTDIRAGQAAGVGRCVLLRTGRGRDQERLPEAAGLPPFAVYDDLQAALDSLSELVAEPARTTE
jgi:HAD superfamily hydrolase (TIGR01662 family)